MVSKVIVVFSLIVALSSAATFRGNLPVKPKEFAHKDGCYVQEINDVIPFGGEVSPSGVCYRVECSSHMIYYSTCPTLGYDYEKCHQTKGDNSRPYPDCCPQVKCEQDNYLF